MTTAQGELHAVESLAQPAGFRGRQHRRPIIPLAKLSAYILGMPESELKVEQFERILAKLEVVAAAVSIKPEFADDPDLEIFARIAVLIVQSQLMGAHASWSQSLTQYRASGVDTSALIGGLQSDAILELFMKNES